jgi:hypothetical protein
MGQSIAGQCITDQSIADQSTADQSIADQLIVLTNALVASGQSIVLTDGTKCQINQRLIPQLAGCLINHAVMHNNSIYLFLEKYQGDNLYCLNVLTNELQAMHVDIPTYDQESKKLYAGSRHLIFNSLGCHAYHCGMYYIKIQDLFKGNDVEATFLEGCYYMGDFDGKSWHTCMRKKQDLVAAESGEERWCRRATVDKIKCLDSFDECMPNEYALEGLYYHSYLNDFLNDGENQFKINIQNNLLTTIKIISQKHFIGIHHQCPEIFNELYTVHYSYWTLSIYSRECGTLVHTIDLPDIDRLDNNVVTFPNISLAGTMLTYYTHEWDDELEATGTIPYNHVIIMNKCDLTTLETTSSVFLSNEKQITGMFLL